MTTHENFLSNVETAIRVIDIDRDDGPATRNLVSVPLFHVTGCNSQLLMQVGLRRHDGGHAGVRRPGVPARGRRRAHRPAHQRARDLLAGAGPAGLRRRTTSRRCSWIAYGGAPIAPALVRRIQEAFPNARVGNGFGLTETSSVATFLPHEWRPSTPTPSASPRRSSTSRWTSPSTASASCWSAGRTSSRATGTSRTRRRRRSSTAGCTPATSPGSTTGFVQIVDRAKDMINRGGENVYCVEVENALAGAPGVVRGRGRRRAGHDDGREGRRGRSCRCRGSRSTVEAIAGLPARSASPTSRCRSTSRCGASRCRATPAARSSSGTCGTAPSGGRRCAELSPSRAAVHRFAECPRAAARRTTLQA